MTEAPDRLIFGQTRLIFLGSAAGKPSTGSAIDHIGFRTPNVTSKTAEYKGQHVKIAAEPRSVTLAGGATVNVAFIEDPGGVKIELVQS